MFQEKNGNLISLAKEGEFDVIAHCTNCFCVQGAGIAPQMVKHFGTDEYELESPKYRGYIQKLGMVDYGGYIIDNGGLNLPQGKINQFEFKKATNDSRLAGKFTPLFVVNLYGQYEPGANSLYPGEIPLNYAALNLGFVKMNQLFKGMRIGLPAIGCGLAGGDIEIVSDMMKKKFTNCDVTLVIFNS